MIWKYTLLWIGLAVIAILNGLLREQIFRRYLKELPAHQVSTVSLIILVSIFTWIFSIIWPLGSTSQALAIGTIWLVITILFEFVFGHYVVKKTWKELFADYNLAQGRIWIFVLAWIFVSPLVFYIL